MENLYIPHFNGIECEHFRKHVHGHVPMISDEFKSIREDDFSLVEIRDALKSMKKGKAPGTDALSVELYLHFWEHLEGSAFNMIQECLAKGEMITTMEQGVISLIQNQIKIPLSQIIRDLLHY
jgi:hypothetical protein